MQSMEDGSAADPITPSPQPARSIVLVGLMGVGKTCIGKRLAGRLGWQFRDADAEVEAAADMTIPEIFEVCGEAAFRDGERRVIARLLDAAPHVLATGGGAFMNPATRDLIKTRAISIWLRADLDLLVKRTAKRNHRPLLKRGDPREVLRDLKAKRDPVYAEADIAVDSVDGPPEQTVARVVQALSRHMSEQADRAAQSPSEDARP
jgi:shikimate kinase